MSSRRWHSVASCCMAAVFMVAGAASGEDASPDARSHRLPGMTVLGSEEALQALGGTGAYLGVDEVRAHELDDIGRILQRVPGVYVRGEDGLGLFPNISLRGTDTTRSSKVTLMEDGILAAPAPYSAPAAYYSPTAGRMEGLEVLKGSSQIRFGPHTTGGVINYVSTSVPAEPLGYVRTVFGSNSDFRLHTYHGETVETASGRLGWLVEGFYRSHEGFRRIDETPDFIRGDQTGFTKFEPTVKLSFEPVSSVYQRFELKLGYTELDANETYLGLTEAHFAADPLRRYSASRFDNIRTEQARSHIRHHAELTEGLRLTSTVYYNQFDRNWLKAHELRGSYTLDDLSVVVNPSLSRALAGGGTALDALLGQGAGTIRYRHNKRSYESFGAETVAESLFSSGAIDNRLSVGLRFHEDSARRFQMNEDFHQDADGVFTGSTTYTPGSQDNRIERARSLALFVENETDIGRLTLKPGVRYEHLRHDFENFNTLTSGEGSMDLVAGGMGATLEMHPGLVAFGGVHLGFSPPEPQRAVAGIKEERSVGSELGLRLGRERLRAEAAAFHTRFYDLLVRDYVGGGGGDDSVGRVVSQGIELRLQHDRQIGRATRSWNLAGTWTDARLGSDTSSGNPESIFSGGLKGNRVPYVPELTLSAGAGLRTARAGVSVGGVWAAETYTTASNTTDQLDTDGNPDARFGTADSYFLLDISGHVQLNQSSRLIGGVQNALDLEYVASRHPHGPRPGAPRSVYVGIEAKW